MTSSQKLPCSDISQFANNAAYFWEQLAKTERPDVAAENLRAFVRERVHKDGALYRRGAATRLARAIGQDKSWVSHYVEADPSARRSQADIDTAFAICDFYGRNLAEFRTRIPQPEVSEHRTPLQVEGAKIAARIEAAWPRLPEPIRQSFRGLVKHHMPRGASHTGPADTATPGPADRSGGTRTGAPVRPSKGRARGA